MPRKSRCGAETPRGQGALICKSMQKKDGPAPSLRPQQRFSRARLQAYTEVVS